MTISDLQKMIRQIEGLIEFSNPPVMNDYQIILMDKNSGHTMCDINYPVEYDSEHNEIIIEVE